MSFAWMDGGEDKERGEEINCLDPDTTDVAFTD